MHVVWIISNRNLPLSIITGLIIVTLVYMAINVSYFTVLPLSELIAAPAVAAVLYLLTLLLNVIFAGDF
jgi:amino acid transporter